MVSCPICAVYVTVVYTCCSCYVLEKASKLLVWLREWQCGIILKIHTAFDTLEVVWILGQHLGDWYVMWHIDLRRTPPSCIIFSVINKQFHCVLPEQILYAFKVKNKHHFKDIKGCVYFVCGANQQTVYLTSLSNEREVQSR